MDTRYFTAEQTGTILQRNWSEEAALQNSFGFADGTILRISCPKINQNSVYNGHERVPGIKFQSLALPNGLIGNFSGPYVGKWHDSTMLHESRLLPNLQRSVQNNN